MAILQKDSYILKSFQAYFTSAARITFQLSQITQLLKIQDNAAQILEEIYHHFSPSSPIQIFKWLILANKLIMEFIIDLTKMSSIIQQFQCKEQNQFDNLLNNKLIKPYKLYLMKRCQFLPKKSANIDRMYQLMNLIQTGTNFSQIIYTLGRYYSKVYPFSADFNVILGSDLTTVYNQMVRYTPKPAQTQILYQYEKIHQKMYIVYYNCYFYKFLKPYVPRWVVTDVLQTNRNHTPYKQGLKTPNTQDSMKQSILKNSSLRKIKDQKTITTMNSSKKISSQTSISQFDLSKSQVFSFQHQSEEKSKQFEESLMLLKSMQRVFEQLQQV